MPRLVQGQNGRVTPGLPNILRSQPGTGANSVIVGEIPGGAEFFVLPDYYARCVAGRTWWFVNYNGVLGWTAEGDVNGPYWTEPVPPYYPPTPVPAGCLPSRIAHATRGIVTSGSPNAIRTQPWRGTGSRVVGYIPAGAIFYVWQQDYPPVCTDGITWVYVTYSGRSGWTPESNSTTYWAEPIYGIGN